MCDREDQGCGARRQRWARLKCIAAIAAVADTLRETVGRQAMIRLDANGAWRSIRLARQSRQYAAAAGVFPSSVADSLPDGG